MKLLVFALIMALMACMTSADSTEEELPRTHFGRYIQPSSNLQFRPDDFPLIRDEKAFRSSPYNYAPYR